jgi:hypothetical protein
MIVLELGLAIVFAKWGGRLACSYDAERLVGWIFILAGLAIATAAGSRL